MTKPLSARSSLEGARNRWIATAFIAMMIPAMVVTTNWPWFFSWPAALFTVAVFANPTRIHRWMRREDRIGWTPLRVASLSLVAHLLVVLVTGAVQGGDTGLPTPQTLSGLIGLLVSGIVFAPIVEELTFRGVVQSGFEMGLWKIGVRRRNAHKVVAAVLAAVVWSLWHLPDGRPSIYTLVGGLTYGLYVAYGGSLRTVIVAHSLVNVLGLSLTVDLYRGGTYWTLAAVITVWIFAVLHQEVTKRQRPRSVAE